MMSHVTIYNRGKEVHEDAAAGYVNVSLMSWYLGNDCAYTVELLLRSRREDEGGNETVS